MTTQEEKIKTSILKHGLKIPCSMEILTPVHVGSGVKLKKGFDFYSDRGKTYVIPQYLISEYLFENTDKLKDFEKEDYIPIDILKDLVSSKIEGIRTYSEYCESEDMFEFEKNGNGYPYIPGSSLKGAIRTAILTKLYKSLPIIDKEQALNAGLNKYGSKNISSVLENKIFSNGIEKRIESNKNLMRLFQVGDVHFEFNSLDIEKSLILSLKKDSPKLFRWKSSGGRRGVDEIEKATAIFAETLTPNAKANFTLKIESSLFGKDKKLVEFFNWNEEQEINIKELAALINEHSIEEINSEIKFFQTEIKCADLFEYLIKGLEEIKQSINKLGEEEFIIRLAWGTGWKAITGDFLEAEWLAKFRSKKNLGINDFPFPKTRKILFEGDLPSTLTGFVKVKLNHTFKMNELSFQQYETIKSEEKKEEDIFTKLSKLGKVKVEKQN